MKQLELRCPIVTEIPFLNDFKRILYLRRFKTTTLPTYSLEIAYSM